MQRQVGQTRTHGHLREDASQMTSVQYSNDSRTAVFNSSCQSAASQARLVVTLFVCLVVSRALGPLTSGPYLLRPHDRIQTFTAAYIVQTCMRIAFNICRSFRMLDFRHLQQNVKGRIGHLQLASYSCIFVLNSTNTFENSTTGATVT